MKWLLRTVLWPTGLVALWGACSVIGALIPGPQSDIQGEPKVRVGLIAGLIHYDFLLPARPDVLDRFAFAEGTGVPIRDPRVAYVVVGWGAREFYTTTGSYTNLSAHAVWTAVTGDNSVMRVDVATPIPPDIPVSWLILSEAQFVALLTAIDAGFDPPPHVVKQPGFTETDAFFAGTGRFHALRTCNVWVAEVLRAAGIRFGAWTPAPWSIRLSLWRFGTG